eukprot:1140499-Pleurochrysis_carterae.AAC.1
MLRTLAHRHHDPNQHRRESATERRACEEVKHSERACDDARDDDWSRCRGLERREGRDGRVEAGLEPRVVVGLHGRWEERRQIKRE